MNRIRAMIAKIEVAVLAIGLDRVFLKLPNRSRNDCGRMEVMIPAILAMAVWTGVVGVAVVVEGGVFSSPPDRGSGDGDDDTPLSLTNPTNGCSSFGVTGDVMFDSDGLEDGLGTNGGMIGVGGVTGGISTTGGVMIGVGVTGLGLLPVVLDDSVATGVAVVKLNV